MGLTQLHTPGFAAWYQKLVSKRRLVIEEVVRETTSGGIVFRRNKDTKQLEILLIQVPKTAGRSPKAHVEEVKSPSKPPSVNREETRPAGNEMYNWSAR